jgi:hypothetical protein
MIWVHYISTEKKKKNSFSWKFEKSRFRDAIPSTVLENLDNNIFWKIIDCNQSFGSKQGPPATHQERNTLTFRSCQVGSALNYFIIGFGQWQCAWNRPFSIEIYFELKNTVMLALESKLLRSRIEMYCSCSRTILLWSRAPSVTSKYSIYSST